MSRIFARRSIRQDEAGIEDIIRGKHHVYLSRYGLFNVAYNIETSVLAVTVVNENDEVIGFASFLDAPPSGMQDGDLEQDKWHVWFAANLKEGDYNISQSIWLSLFVVNDKAVNEKEIEERLLQTAFSTLQNVEAILALVPQELHLYDPVEDYFTELRKSDKEKSLGVRVFSCHRDTFVPAMAVRKARIEDHDDLVPIFNEQSEVLTEIYGEYFLADLIEAQNDHNHSIVADVDGRAVGLMSITDEVDISLLQQCFDLELFDFLLTASHAEKYRTELEKAKDFIHREKAGAVGTENAKAYENALAKMIGEKSDWAGDCHVVSSTLIRVIMARSRAMKEAESRAVFNAFQLRALNCYDVLVDDIKLASKNALLVETKKDKAESEENDEEVASSDSNGTVAAKEMQDNASPMNAMSKKLTLTEQQTFALKAYSIVDMFIQDQIVANLDKVLIDAMKANKAADKRDQKDGGSTEHFDLMAKAELTEALVVRLKETVYEGLDIFLETGKKIQPSPTSFCKSLEDLCRRIGMNGIYPWLVVHVEHAVGMVSRKQSIALASDKSAAAKAEARALAAVYSTAECTNNENDDDEDEETLGRRLLKDAMKGVERGADNGQNVFAITLFCLDDTFESRVVDFLSAAFELFPERQYCLVTLPQTCEEYPLLSHFTLVKALPSNTLDHALYLLHRDSLNAVINVNWAFGKDVEDVEKLMKGLGSDLLQCFHACLKDEAESKELFLMEKAERRKIRADAAAAPKPRGGVPSLVENNAEAVEAALDEETEYEDVRPARRRLAPFTMRIDGQLIGVALLEAQMEVEGLKADFSVEDFVSLEDIKSVPGAKSAYAKQCPQHANLLYFVINPLFQRSRPYVLRELLRLYKKNVLYYRVFPDTSLQDVISLMRQVRPRRKPLLSQELINTILTEEKERQLKKDAHAKMFPLSTVGAKFQKLAVTSELAKTFPTPSRCGTDLDAINAFTSADSHLFSLHLVTRRLLCMPKAQLNARIVVVGSSDTGLSFLETMLLHPELNFSNLTMLSTSGLSNGRRAGRDGQFLPWSFDFDECRLQRLAIKSRVKVIKDTLFDLDCKTKKITLGSKQILPYDYLILTSGLQDQTINKLDQAGGIVHRVQVVSSAPVAGNTKGAKGMSTNIVSPPLSPTNSSSFGTASLSSNSPKRADMIEGVFSLSNDHDVSNFLMYHNRTSPKFLCVYGCTLESVSIIHGLLDRGIAPKSIMWVYPRPLNSTAWSFGDKLVAEKVVNVITGLGVVVFHNTKLAGIVAEGGRLAELVFERLGALDEVKKGRQKGAANVVVERKHEEEEDNDVDVDSVDADDDTLLEDDTEDGKRALMKLIDKKSFSVLCQCLISTNQKDADPFIFQACMNNSLVYDGRLVVDGNFKTVDPNVFAAGPLTKFGRHYGQSLLHQQYNAKELGQKLVECVLRSVDPAVRAEEAENARQGRQPSMPAAPKLGYAPKAVYAALPGGVHFLHVNKPGLPCKRPKVLLTTVNDRICRLVFDETDVLRSLSYVGVSEIVSQNLIHLVGLPASYLNNILGRFAQEGVTDLVDFLEDNWSTALFHESFPELRLVVTQGLCDILRQDEEKDQEEQDDDDDEDKPASWISLVETVAEMRKASHESEIDSSSISKLAELIPQDARHLIQTRLLQFLYRHQEHLPLYGIGVGDEKPSKTVKKWA